MGDKKIKNRRVLSMRNTFNAIVDGAHDAPYKLKKNIHPAGN